MSHLILIGFLYIKHYYSNWFIQSWHQHNSLTDFTYIPVSKEQCSTVEEETCSPVEEEECSTVQLSECQTSNQKVCNTLTEDQCQTVMERSTERKCRKVPETSCVTVNTTSCSVVNQRKDSFHSNSIFSFRKDVKEAYVNASNRNYDFPNC